MEKNKNSTILNYAIIIISVIIALLLCYLLFFNKSEISFDLNEKNMQLKIGEIKKINYSLSNSNLKVEWSSSSDSITINENGEMTANNYGTVIITGSVYDGEKSVSDSCIVTVYSGDIGVLVEKIEMPDGYILMPEDSEFDLAFTVIPSNAYLTAVNYSSSDENIAIIENNKIKSLQSGLADITIEVNDSISANINLKVSSDEKENRIVKKIESVSFQEESVTMEIDDVKQLLYNISPEDGYVTDINWTSSNENVVSVIDGEIRAINEGEAIINLDISDVHSSIKVTVLNNKKLTDDAYIMVDYNPKTLIRVGEKTTIKAHIEPSNIDRSITYQSSNTSIAIVDNGTVTALKSGSVIITLSLENGKTKSFNLNVLPTNGMIEGSGGLWGYKSLNAKVPVLADSFFFQKLAQSGVGIIQNNTYMITIGGENYSYNISGNVLSVSNKTIKLRIYYPNVNDLSTLNTLVFMGGRGETNFGGMFADMKNNTSIMKSAGMLGLIAEGGSFDGKSGAYTTKFLKAIIKQKSGAKNSILGFSDGAHQVLDAAYTENYDKIIIFSGYVDNAGMVQNAKNSEIIFCIAGNDGNYSQMKVAANNMRSSGYQSVTIVSTGSDLSSFTNKFLVIRPVGLMKNGHLSENVLSSGIIEYAND